MCRPQRVRRTIFQPKLLQQRRLREQPLRHEHQRQDVTHANDPVGGDICVAFGVVEVDNVAPRGG